MGMMLFTDHQNFLQILGETGWGWRDRLGTYVTILVSNCVRRVLIYDPLHSRSKAHAAGRTTGTAGSRCLGEGAPLWHSPTGEAVHEPSDAGDTDQPSDV